MEKVLPFHDTLKIERHFKASPTKVFDAFKNPDIKFKWFVAPDENYRIAERSIDFRVGGKEILRGSFPSGTTTSYDALFYDIVANERIVYAYDLLINGQRFSVTLATLEFHAENGGTKLIFTEQNAFIHAPKDANASRIHGISWHLDNLARLL